MKVFLTSRAFLILSLLCLSSISVFGFFQDSPARVKTKYEFTDTRISQADTLLKKRQYEEALDAYQKAYDIYESESFYEGMVYAKERMGRTYRSLGRHGESAKLYTESIQLARTHLPENHILLGKAYLNNGIRGHYRDQAILASNYIDSAKVVFDRSNRYDSALLKSLIDFKFYTYFYSQLSKDTLIKYLNEKGRWYEAKGSSLEESIYLLSDYNRAYFRIGDYQKSVAYGLEAVRQCEQSLEIIRPFYYTDALFNLARALHYQKKPQRALSVADKLIDFAIKTDSRISDLVSYINLKAVVLTGSGRFEEAAEEFNSLLELLEKTNNKSDFYRAAIMNLGVCYQRMGDFEMARSLLEKALREEKKVNELFDISFVQRYKFLGQMYFSKGDFSKALAYYDSALRNGISGYTNGVLEFPTDNITNTTYETLSILMNKQMSLEKYYSNLSPSADTGEEILESVASYALNTHQYLMANREDLMASEGKLFLSENFKPMYESALNGLYQYHILKPKDDTVLKRAFKFFSISKSILYLEQSGELGEIQDSRLPTALKMRFYNLKKSIESREQMFYRLIDDIVTNDSLRVINSELLKLDSDLEKFRDSLKTYINTEFEVAGPNDGEYDRLLSFLEENPKRAIIEYFVGDDMIFILLLSSNKRVFSRVNISDAFDKTVELFESHISNRPSISGYKEGLIDYERVANSLYKSLVENVVVNLDSTVSEITIIPDSKLSRLPFEAFVTRIDEEKKYYSDLAYLLNDFTINYALSSKEVGYAYEKRKSRKNLIGIGFGGTDFSETRSRSNANSLPGTEKEIQFLEANFEGDFLFGVDGGKDVFIEKAKDYDILHLAVHGLSDSSDRYQSSLVFNGPESGNILKTSDLYIAELNARLAILSACESGLGEITKGEGTFSIARGFALAGVPSIVMSLWKVNDKAAAELMVELHTNLKKGQRVNVALANSKRDFLATSEQFTSHPYYWSSFVSLGQEIRIDEDRSFKPFYLIIFIVLMSLLGLILFRKRKGANKPLL